MSRKRQRVYVGIMTVGAIALAVDQFALDATPKLAPILTNIHETKVAAATLTAGLATTTTSEPLVNLPIPEVPFPRGVENYASVIPTRDLFTRAPAAGTTGNDEATPDKDKTADEGSERKLAISSDVFSARRRLNAVVMVQRLRIAVVDGKWVRVGQIIDGCELKSVSGNKARFVCHDGDAVLFVDAPRASSPD